MKKPAPTPTTPPQFRAPMGRPAVLKESKNTTIVLEKGQLDALDEYCRTRGITRGQAIREAVDQFLEG